MTSYKEILRLYNLGINNSRIASGCGCSRTTVINVLQRAKDQGLNWQTVAEMSDKELSQRLFPSESAKPAYKMPDYEYIYREMAKSGVTSGFKTRGQVFCFKLSGCQNFKQKYLSPCFADLSRAL